MSHLTYVACDDEIASTRFKEGPDCVCHTIIIYRVIAVDLIGFGKSDKPVNKVDYTYQRHVDWIREVIEKLNLKSEYKYRRVWHQPPNC